VRLALTLAINRLRNAGPGGAPPPYVPSLDFSDDRNSQYVPLVF